MKISWPKQSECLSFYGNPRDSSFEENLVSVPFPWMAVLAWKTSQRCKSAPVHEKCADSLSRVFASLWESSGRSQDKINEWGMNLFGGGYCFRQMRGSKKLSMHAYGCAVDFDPADNAMGDTTPEFAIHPVVLAAFKAEGWVWGGGWKTKDGMHFQAAIVG